MRFGASRAARGVFLAISSLGRYFWISHLSDGDWRVAVPYPALLTNERGGTGWFVLGLRWTFCADGWLLRCWLESG